MPSSDATPRGNISFLELKDLPRWYDNAGDAAHSRVATATIDGIVLYAIFDEHSEYPEATALEDGGETRSAARADCTRSQAPSSRQKQGMSRGSKDSLGDLAAAIESCPVHHLVIQFTPDAGTIDPGKTFCDSMVLFNPRKLTVGLDMDQWPIINCCLESLPHRAAHFQLCKILVVSLEYEVNAHEDLDKLQTELQQMMPPFEKNAIDDWTDLDPNIHLTFVQTASAIITRAPQVLVEAESMASIYAGCEFTL